MKRIGLRNILRIEPDRPVVTPSNSRGARWIEGKPTDRIEVGCGVVVDRDRRGHGILPSNGDGEVGRRDVDPPFDQLGLLQVRHGLVAAKKFIPRQVIAGSQWRGRFCIRTNAPRPRRGRHVLTPLPGPGRNLPPDRTPARRSRIPWGRLPSRYRKAGCRGSPATARRAAILQPARRRCRAGPAPCTTGNGPRSSRPWSWGGGSSSSPHRGQSMDVTRSRSRISVNGLAQIGLRPGRTDRSPCLMAEGQLHRFGIRLVAQTIFAVGELGRVELVGHAVEYQCRAGRDGHPVQELEASCTSSAAIIEAIVGAVGTLPSRIWSRRSRGQLYRKFMS